VPRSISDLLPPAAFCQQGQLLVLPSPTLDRDGLPPFTQLSFSSELRHNRVVFLTLYKRFLTY